ncbi:uncharacterized protein LOC111785335 [Cucurbita pepo subsp. pepo]|uniref:uncharacterized protein LOC111785335 n=1 Tax=Cucurbita pepo subsp. pepo TaxID=3664 RepID=UPI000C9D94BF|nr:uncharacterized protein LOC111785335 [Cucurbita pepo subsp. pepo]
MATNDVLLPPAEQSGGTPKSDHCRDSKVFDDDGRDAWDSKVNRSPTRRLYGKTSYEAWYNKKLAVHHFRVFDCIAYMKVVHPHLAKLDPRGLKVVFIGYEPRSKNDVIEVDQNPNQFTVEYLITEPREGGAQHRELSPTSAAVTPKPVEFATPRTADSTLDVDHDDDLVARYRRMDDLVGGGEPPGLATRELEEVTELHAISTDEPNTFAKAERNPCCLKVHHMDVKSAFLNGELKETIDVQQPPGFLDNDNPGKNPNQFTVEYLITEPREGGAQHRELSPTSAAVTPKPVEFATPRTADSTLDVDHDDDLVARYRRMDDLVGGGEPPGLATRELEEVTELHAIAQMNRTPSPKQKGTHARIEKGEVVKHKAHLVAKGYIPKQGVDFEEVFALVTRLEFVRLLLVIATHCSWEVHHMDVKSFFLNGELKETIDVQQPPGFLDNDNPSKVLRLHKALYGLRQAPRAWNAKLDSILLSVKFKCCASEHGMYTHDHDEQRLILGVYVDDLIITGGDMEVLGRFKREMSKNFKMSDLGILNYYLGIKVQQSTTGITICQNAYAKKLLDTTGLADSNPTRMPMEARLQLRKASTTTTVDATNYHNIVGSLHYLVNTRPDLTYSVGYVSRFMEAPRKEHLVAAKCILRYVAGV